MSCPLVTCSPPSTLWSALIIKISWFTRQPEERGNPDLSVRHSKTSQVGFGSTEKKSSNHFTLLFYDKTRFERNSEKNCLRKITRKVNNKKNQLKFPSLFEI